MPGWPEPAASLAKSPERNGRLARRLERAGWALALLACLPAAFLWRKFGFKVASFEGEMPAGSGNSAGAVGGIAPTTSNLAVAARWLGNRAPRPLNCLTLALAAQWLLRFAGQPSRIQIGVRIDETGDFHSHAWLVSHGHAVTGGPLGQGYTEILALDR